MLWMMSGCAPSAAPVASYKAELPDAGTFNVASERERERVRQILCLMRDRLELMHAVARWKWNQGKPISDPERERQLLAELGNRAERLGLSTTIAREFFQAQFDAGKLIQEADFTAWQAESQGKFAEVPDLSQVIRPRIDQLSNQLLAELAELEQAFSHARATQGPSAELATEKGLVGSAWRSPEIQAEFRSHAAELLAAEGITDSVRSAALAPLLR